jgi:hypothetical protein
MLHPTSRKEEILSWRMYAGTDFQFRSNDADAGKSSAELSLATAV